MSLSYKLTYKIKVFMAESPVCKIPRKFVHATSILLLGTALTCWIYWKPSTKFKPTPIKWDLFNNVSLQPFPTPCKSDTFLVIIVTSYVGHVEHRMAHRTFTPEVELWKINATRVFLLAQIPENEKKINQSAINDESKTFGDILQGKFIDNYRNLTYKHLMALKWASTICQDASFILKVDDDTVYNLNRTYELLNSIKNTTNLILGHADYTPKVQRGKTHKRYVSWEEYPEQRYPTYVFGGYYITTPRVAAALCDEAIYHHFFWIDDVFVTGILAEAVGIKITDMLRLSYYRFLNCHCCSEVYKGMKVFVCNGK